MGRQDANGRGSLIGGLVAELLAERSSAGADRRLRSVQSDFRRLSGINYVEQLRAQFDHSAIRELIAVATTQMWPHLNRRQMKARSPAFFGKLAAGLGVDFQAYPYDGPLGLGLRGFYIDAEHGPRRRPLIFVNTAHAQAVIAATFCHEIGHHLGAEIFPASDPASFFFYTGYEDHLHDSVELAADVLVSLATYPQAIARTLFGDPQKDRLPATSQELTDAILKRVLTHLRGHFRFDIGRMSLPEQRLQYLAGAIHFAKLRWALLAEYRI